MFMDPGALLSACHINSSESIADFGAGSGFVARAAAKLVPQGNVFAIEINRDIVARLTREAADAHMSNLHPLWGDIEVSGGTKLGEASMDMVIISNTLFHLEDKDGCFKEAVRVLKPGGRLLVVDWSESFGGMGPRPQAVVTKEMAVALATRYGFQVQNDTLPAGEHHYAILFRKV
jgi:ubiquinone/menaquinone biosynthesis C-methylase UbiE